MNETIFDFGISEKEMDYIYISFRDKVTYLENTSPKKRLHDMYLLFCLRDDKINRLSAMIQIKELSKSNRQRMNPGVAA